MRPRIRRKAMSLLEFIRVAILVINAVTVRTAVFTASFTLFDATRFESFSAGSALNTSYSHLRNLRMDLERLGPFAPLQSRQVRLRDLQRRNLSE